MPVQPLRNRRAFNCNAPKFQLGELPQRNLQPMSAVSRDSEQGTTSYALQGAGHSADHHQAGGVTSTCGAPQGYNPDANHTNLGNNNSDSGTTISSSNGSEDMMMMGCQMQAHCATCVTPHLYLGGQGDASSACLLRKLKIRRILNVAGECMPHSDSDNEAEMQNIVTKHIEIRDHSDENIAGHFHDALAFIHVAIQSQEPVLVHCRFGVSRSATIVIAYLMQYGTTESVVPKPLSYEIAFDFVKARRPQVSPNLGFVLALHQLDRENGGNEDKDDGAHRSSAATNNQQQQSAMVC